MKSLLVALAILGSMVLDSRTINALDSPSGATTAMSAAAFLVNAENNSHETGTVYVTPITITRTQILIVVTGEPHHATQPAHMHHGSCGRMNPAPAFALKPLINGRSKTTILDSLGDVLSGNYVSTSTSLQTTWMSTSHAPSSAQAMLPQSGQSGANFSNPRITFPTGMTDIR